MMGRADYVSGMQTFVDKGPVLEECSSLMGTIITSAGWMRILGWQTLNGTGSTLETTAGSVAWTWSPSRQDRSTTGSRDSLMEVSSSSGHPEGNVTLMGVTNLSSSPN